MLRTLLALLLIVNPLVLRVHSLPVVFRSGYIGDGESSGGNSRRLVVFGDSFSDDGHGAWIVSNMTWPADPAYSGHHFSNGPVWAQNLAKSLHLELTDLATGGATANNSVVAGFTGPNSTIPVPASQEQLDTFISTNAFRTDDVVVDYIGANDALFSSNATGESVASLIAGQVEQLYNKGARNIILASYPDFSLAPFAQNMEESSKSFLRTFFSDLDSGLFAIQRIWSAKGLNIQVVDIFKLFNDIFSDPEAYGFDADVVHSACLQGVYSGEGVPRSLCAEPDKYLFWDVYHPSAVAHELIAKAFEDVMHPST